MLFLVTVLHEGFNLIIFDMLRLCRHILAVNSDMSLVTDETGARLWADATSNFTGLDGRELLYFLSISFTAKRLRRCT